MSAKPANKDGSETATLPFEQALEEVESIIRRIETGEAGLEESITQYERGVQLIKQCREVLGRVEQRVVDLTAQMQAAAVVEKAGRGGDARSTGT